MDDPNRPRSLDDLDARLRAARKSDAEKKGPDQAEGAGPLGVAWRLAIEMAVALAVGGFIGWWLDYWLGTRPWMLIGFFMLGAATGMVNAFRAARQINRQIGGTETRRDDSRGKR